MIENYSQIKKWKGDFGIKYTNRNAISLSKLDGLYLKNFGVTRTALNNLFIGKFNRRIRILEVGCNVGNQLLLLQGMGFNDLYGVEINSYAVEFLKTRSKGINVVHNSAFDIPFKDGYFDLVFTSGVLIHIHPKNIRKALREIYRCAKRYIWGYEYYSKHYTEVPYRRQKGLLWKADFAKIYSENFPDLEITKTKSLKYLKDDNADTMFLLKKKIKK